MFKAGNHIRNKVMFEKLVEHGFEIDTTCVSNHKVVRQTEGKNVTLFDDSKVENEPFNIKTENGDIFEIPEMQYGLSKLRELLKTYDKEYLFIRLQIHPWEILDEGPECLMLSLNHIMNFLKLLIG